MLSRVLRFLSTATLGVSLASTAVVALFSVLMLAGLLIQPCVGIYRQDHAQYDFILDSVGLPLMSGFFALMSWKVSGLCRDLRIDGPFNWVLVHDARLLVTGLLVIAGSNLAMAVLICNRYAAILTYCRALQS